MRPTHTSTMRTAAMIAVVWSLAIAVTSASAADEPSGRDAGIAAVKAGEYRPGLATLLAWNAAHPGDADVLCHIAIARRHLPLRRQAHIAQAIGWLRAALAVDADHAAAQDELLELYRMTGQNAEALALADRVLARSPGDFGALRSRAAARFATRDFAAARDDALAAMKAKPDDAQVITLALLSYYRMNQPDQALAMAKRLHEAEPDAMVYQLTYAFGYILTNDRQNAVAMLRRAAAHEMPDGDTATMLVRQFDSIGLYDEATALLEREAPRLEAAEPAELSQALLHRLYQIGRWQDVVDRVTDKQPEADDPLLARMGLRAMSLIALKRGADAAPLIDALNGYDDPVAKAWGTLLDDLRGRLGGAGLVRLRTAVAADPFNPYLRERLAWRMLEAGEPAMAVEQFDAAAKLAPAWVMPHTGMADAYGRLNRLDKAVLAAQEALRRGPRNAAAIVVFARAMHRLAVGTNNTKAADGLLDLLTKVQAASPDEPNTLAIYVDLLAWRDRAEEAKAILRRVAAADPPAPASLRQALQAVSDRRELGVDLIGGDDPDNPSPKEPAP